MHRTAHVNGPDVDGPQSYPGRIAGFLLHSQALLLLPHTMGAHGSPKAEAWAQRRPPHELWVLWRTKDFDIAKLVIQANKQVGRSMEEGTGPA